MSSIEGESGKISHAPITSRSLLHNHNRCITDGNGPDVFQKCSKRWVNPEHQGEDYKDEDYGRYDYVRGHGYCETATPPPSAHDAVCKSFHGKINDLR